jgi:hypothetical protein
MARSSYLKQIVKRTTLGLPVLRPPFAPFGPPAPQSLASGLQTDTFKTSTRAATDVSRTKPETPTPRSDQATPERPRALAAPEITPAPQPPASVPHSQRQPESTAPDITPAPRFSSPVSETRGPESHSSLPVRVPTGTVAESKPVVEEREAPPTSSELTNRPSVAPRRLTAEDGAAAVKIETVRHSEFPREPMLELSGPRPITQKPLRSPAASSVHIGAIEVHITPPAMPPAPVPPPRAQSQSAATSLPTTALSRGYLSTFGIRQG